MDALNHLNLAWAFPFVAAVGAVGAGIGWLLDRRKGERP